MVVANGYYSDGRTYGKKARAQKPPFSRLFEAMRASGERMRRHREERYDAVRQFVGTHYSDEGASQPVPINLVSRYTQVMGKFLIPAVPRVMIAARNRKGAPAVHGMQEWANKQFKKMAFDETLQEWVTNAFYGTSVLKVALSTPADAASGGYALPAGEPFAEVVDLDDFRFDPGARVLKKAGWFAHRYRVAVDLARKLDYFDKKERSKIVGESPGNLLFNGEGDERVNRIGRNYTSSDSVDYRDMTDLWEVYIPELKRVYTFRSDSGGGVPPADAVPLRVQEWIGPHCGPYHFLTLLPVPGNAWGKGVVLDLLPLHNTVNQAYSKLIDQLLAQKRVYATRRGGSDDGMILINASDGEAVSVDDPTALETLEFGGPDQKCAVFSTHLTDVFNQQAGNLAVLSGSSPQAKTATQERMLSENANSGVADMQGKTLSRTSQAIEAMCWYWWYHPELVMKHMREVPGLPEFNREVSVYPGNFPDEKKVRRAGSFEELDCRIDPYSMAFKTPQQKLAGFMGVVEKFLPAIPILAQQNIQMDLQFAIKKIGEYMDEPDIEQLFTIAPTPENPRPQGGDGGGMSMKPASTERNYTRTSVGQDTEASRFAEMANAAASEE